MSINTLKPTVSIGMPVYNGEKYLKDALDSLLGQTFTDFELIVSDNASTDNTETICQNYAKRDHRIKYIRQPKNGGAWNNFQFVLHAASGEYFMWAACDDIWHPSWVSNLYEKLKSTKNTAVFGKLIHIDEFSKNILLPVTKNSFNFSGSLLKRKVTFFLEFEGVGKANLFHSLFRKQDIDSRDLLVYSLDYYALFDWLNDIEFLSSDDIFLYKRIHADSAAASKPKSLLSKVIEVITLKTVLSSFNNAVGYLKYSYGFERLIIALLIPIKVVLDHMFYLKRIFIKLR